MLKAIVIATVYYLTYLINFVFITPFKYLLFQSQILTRRLPIGYLNLKTFIGWLSLLVGSFISFTTNFTIREAMIAINRGAMMFSIY